MATHKIDAKGMQCPGPIVQVFKTVNKAAKGDIIQVEATDKGFVKDIRAWCKKTGNQLVKQGTKGPAYTATIKKA